MICPYPIFSQVHCSGRVGVYIFENPLRQEFYSPPSFMRSPPLEGYFQGWGVHKVLPRNFQKCHHIFDLSLIQIIFFKMSFFSVWSMAQQNLHGWLSGE